MSLIKAIVNGLYKVKMEGLEKLKFEGPTIIIANHTSLLDAAVFVANLPKEVCFVANTQIAKKYATLMKGREIITVDPLNPLSVRKMIKVVKTNKPLVIFPEGRITTTGGLMKVYSGISYIALRTGATIYPISLNGTERSTLSYLKGKIKRELFPNVRATVGEPFKIEVEEGLRVKQQREASSNFILRKLQEELFKSRFERGINLFDKILQASDTYGKNLVISEDISSKLTYKKLLLTTYGMSRKLDKVLSEEKNVGVLLPNSNGHLVTLLSLFKLGKTPAILNFSVGKQTLVDCIETAQLKTVLTSREFIEKGKLEHLIEAVPEGVRVVYLEDIKSAITGGDKIGALTSYLSKEKAKSSENELILFTSGSESKPKAVILTHDNIFANIHQARSSIDLTSKDKFLNALPMFHSFGLSAGTLFPIVCGIPVFLYPTPLHYKVIPEVAYDKNATIMFGTSTFLEGYGKFAHPYDFAYSLRYVFAGAEKLKDEVRSLWADKFGIRIFEGYGITETAPILSLNTPLFNKKGTVGRFLPGIEYKLEAVEGVEDGFKLLVKGPNVMKGYLIHGEGFKPASEWYDTGDVVSVDKDGFVSIKSRLKRFAKIGGEMVSLNRLEEIASQCFSEVKGASFAAVNVPDQRKGEKILLFTTVDGIEVSALRDFLSKNGHTALFAPAKIVKLEKLPLLGSGKTDYVQLKELAIKE